MSKPDDKAERYLQECAALDSERAPWEGLWQDLADVCHPRRNLITTRVEGAPDRSTVAQNFDGTAMRANRTLANGQASRITPMGARWMALRPPLKLRGNQEARRWYNDAGEILHTALSVSNFYNRAHEHYLDRGAFGTAATEVTSGPKGKGLHFRSYAVGTFSFGVNSQDEADTLTRTYRWTAGQILKQWGEKAPEIVKKWQADPHEKLKKREIVCYIFPRLDRDPRAFDGLNKPLGSIHILKEQKLILGEGGFDDFPVAVSRWETWGDSQYGWAPAYTALPEATQANFLEQMLDTLAEVAAFPRVLYPAGMKGDINFNALGLTCFDPGNGAEGKPQEWLTAGRYDIGKDRANDKRRAIEESFYTPLFNAISQLDRDATATEVRAIVSESRELFHPIFANLTREFLGPILRRSFALLLQQGEIPPPPRAVLMEDELGAFIADPEVEYTSAMALALEQSQLANFADVMGVLAPLAGQDPGVFDFIDTDRIGAEFMRYKGLPEEFIRTPEAVAAMREARAQAARIQQAEQAAGTVQKLGGAPGIRQLTALAS